MTINSTSEIINALKKGEMVIIMDDENRENEGDLVVPASNITAKKINFMAKYGRGLICLSLTDKQAKKLNLSLMSPINKSRNQTAFTISIEAKRGVTTGISAKDRYTTIKNTIKNNDKKEDSNFKTVFVQYGIRSSFNDIFALKSKLKKKREECGDGAF